MRKKIHDPVWTSDDDCVTRRITFVWLDNGWSRIPAVMSWSPMNPFEVLLDFTNRNAVWAFSLDLLADGLNYPTGLGDVSVLPDFEDPHCVELILSAPSGRVGLRVPRRTIREFLSKINQVRSLGV